MTFSYIMFWPIAYIFKPYLYRSFRCTRTAVRRFVENSSVSESTRPCFYYNMYVCNIIALCTSKKLYFAAWFAKTAGNRPGFNEERGHLNTSFRPVTNNFRCVFCVLRFVFPEQSFGNYIIIGVRFAAVRDEHPFIKKKMLSVFYYVLYVIKYYSIACWVFDVIKIIIILDTTSCNIIPDRGCHVAD